MRTFTVLESSKYHAIAMMMSDYHRAANVDELTNQNVRTVVELERAAKATTSLAGRFATGIAKFCGSMLFVWLHVAWFGAWIAWNASPWFSPHPDPFPFTFLTLVVSLEAIFLSAFILISQNDETRLTERRSHLDLQINLLAEQENTKMLKMLDAIAAKVGANVGGDPELDVLQEATRPDRLLEQIEQATALTGKG